MKDLVRKRMDALVVLTISYASECAAVRMLVCVGLMVAIACLI